MTTHLQPNTPQLAAAEARFARMQVPGATGTAYSHAEGNRVQALIFAAEMARMDGAA